MRGAHVEHLLHSCDLGRVEAERLIECHRVLPSRKQGKRWAWAGGSARAACTGRGPGCKGWGARACAERTKNMRCMVVTLDVSKLSGWLNAAATCQVERRGVQCGTRCGLGARGRGPAAAHEHVAHVSDAGRVEAQRLVEHRRALPSRKEGIRCGARCGPGARGRGPAAAHERHAWGEGPTEGWGS